MKRIEALKLRCSQHLLYRRLYKRLNQDQFDRVLKFIRENDSLSPKDFSTVTHKAMMERQFDGDIWTNAIMDELIHVSNVAAERETFNEKNTSRIN